MFESKIDRIAASGSLLVKTKGALLGAALLLSTCISANAEEDEWSARQKTIQLASASFRAGDFEDLVLQMKQYTTTDLRTPSGGFKIQQFDDGIDAALKPPRGDAEAFYVRTLEMTRNWTETFPDEPLAYILHGNVLLDYAYYFRGGGFTNTVPPLAMEEFRRQATNAADFLLRHQEVAVTNTGWHAMLLNVGRALGWERELIFRIAGDGIKRNPNDFRIYQNTVEYLLPRWYGDAEQLDDFINLAAEKTSKEHGLEIYARLYSGVGQSEYKHRLYDKSRLDRKKMRQGLTDWSTRFPTAWNLNIFAYQSCMARDKALTRELLAKIADNVLLNIWEPNGEVMYNSCKRWAE